MQRILSDISFHKLSLKATLVCFLVLSVHANAQTLDDIGGAITQTQQFGDALEISRQQQRRAALGDLAKEIEGEPGIYVLTEADIFFLSAQLNAGYTDNPQGTSDGEEKGSRYGSFAFSGGISSQFPNFIDYGLNFAVSGVEYSDSDAPDSRSFTSSVFIGKSFADGLLYASLGLNAGTNGDGEFQNTTRFYGWNATVNAPIQLAQNVSLTPSISLERQKSSEDEQDNTVVSTGAQLTWLPTNKLQLSLQGNFSDREYDDFFEDVTFVERDDDIYTLGARATTVLPYNVQASASASMRRNRSTFFLSDYTAYDTSLSLNLTKRF